jgi:hypothetical protein
MGGPEVGRRTRQGQTQASRVTTSHNLRRPGGPGEPPGPPASMWAMTQLPCVAWGIGGRSIAGGDPGSHGLPQASTKKPPTKKC